MTSQKWLVSEKIDLRKRLDLIDVGAETSVVQTAPAQLHRLGGPVFLSLKGTFLVSLEGPFLVSLKRPVLVLVTGAPRA